MIHRIMIICSVSVSTQFSLLCSSWVDEILNGMTLREKIGQTIAMCVEMGDDQQAVFDLIREYAIGSVIPLNQRIPTTTPIVWNFVGYNELIRNLNNLYPHAIRTPITIITDAEWGCAMRIPELLTFPKLMTLGAIPSEKEYLIYDVGKAIGMQCAALGIHINCAPVVDVNSNPANPVIGMRSFGDDPVAVTRKVLLYTQGLCDSGIVPCFKHFPGHGNTLTDSHISLPVIHADYAYLCRYDLIPFKELFYRTLCACMIGHIAMPGLEQDNVILPASISPAIITSLLKHELGFNGLILTDALNMDALNNFGTSAQVSLAALKAGADMLLCPQDIKMVIEYVEQAIREGSYAEQELDTHVLKILTFKEKLNLHTITKTPRASFNDYGTLIQEAYDSAATPYNNIEAILPLNTYEAAYEAVTLGFPTIKLFPTYDPGNPYKKPLLVYLYPGSYKVHQLSADIKKILHTLTMHYKTVILLFGSPYCLRDIPSNIPTLVLYEDVPCTTITAQKIITGSITPHGKLPVAMTIP